jgi:hypothetical protein
MGHDGTQSKGLPSLMSLQFSGGMITYFNFMSYNSANELLVFQVQVSKCLHLLTLDSMGTNDANSASLPRI